MRRGHRRSEQKRQTQKRNTKGGANLIRRAVKRKKVIATRQITDDEKLAASKGQQTLPGFAYLVDRI
jgi:hypothetical protein